MAPSSINVSEASSVDEVKSIQKFEIEELLESLNYMHRSVCGTLSESSKNAVDRNNKRSGVLSCNLNVRDYVVVARTRVPRTKYQRMWLELARYFKLFQIISSVCNQLITRKTDYNQISPVNRYADALVGKSVQMKEIAGFSDRIWYFTDKLKDIREENG